MARKYKVTYSNGKRHIAVTTTANTKRSAERVGRWKLLDELRRTDANATKQDAQVFYPIGTTFVGHQ